MKKSAAASQQTSPIFTGVHPASWHDLLSKLRSGQSPAAADIVWALQQILRGDFAEADACAFLLELRHRTLDAALLAAGAGILREHMIRWDAGPGEALDNCGTGGDQSGTFNISTATAFVLAGAGVRVIKHGNRAVSSNSGSVDVLSALGVPLATNPAEARASLDSCNLAFCFAPSFHPALGHIAAVRKKLGVPTLFNALGPLANPAGVERQLLGVGQAELLDPMAGAMAELGCVRAMVLHSADGLDEISLGGATWVREVRAGKMQSHTWQPDDFGLEAVKRADLLAADADASALIIRKVFDGADIPAARVVLANAAAGLMVADRVPDLASGVAMARTAITSGAARHVLERLQQMLEQRC